MGRCLQPHDDRMTFGSRMIAAERTRQVEKEGYTAAHDDVYKKSELIRAALCYLLIEAFSDVYKRKRPDETTWWPWPWAQEHWKPADSHLGNLVKAGALIAAEIDRRARDNRFGNGG